MNGLNMFVRKNSSTILSCLAAVGVVGTAIVTAKVSVKAEQIIAEEEYKKNDDLTVVEKIKLAGPIYIPSIMLCASTIACIFGANVLNKRKQASLASAYALIDNSFKEYRKKVNELYGEDADLNIKTDISKDRLSKVKDMADDSEKMLFCDFFSGYVFESTLEQVLKAEFIFNEIFKLEGYVVLNELYDLFGIPRIDSGCDWGWSSSVGEFSGYDQIKFTHELIADKDGKQMYTIIMDNEPEIGFIF